MKQLRFTTTEPASKVRMLIAPENNPPLFLPPDMGELNLGDTIAKEARIDGDALDLAGFHVPKFIDGDMDQLDLPLKKQDIIMLLPHGEYKCQATLHLSPSKYDSENDTYLITLKK